MNEVPPCRLKSGKPYNKEAQEMLSVIPEDRSKDAWHAAMWKQEWEASGPTRVHRHVSDPGEGVKGYHYPSYTSPGIHLYSPSFSSPPFHCALQ